MADGVLVHIAKDSVGVTGLHGRYFALPGNMSAVNSTNALYFDVSTFMI